MATLPTTPTRRPVAHPPRPRGRRLHPTTRVALSFAVLVAASAAEAQPAAAPRTVAVTVTERAGVARDGEYVQFGLPLPRAWDLTDLKSVTVRGAGKPLPAQLEPTCRWGAAPDDAKAPIKWLLVGCPVSVAPGGTATLTLTAGGPPARPVPAPVRLQRQDGQLLVDTGAARFALREKGFNLLHQVTIDGRDLLASLDGRQAIAYQPVGERSVVPVTGDAGRPDFTPRPEKLVVERPGPLRAVVRATGSILDAAGRAVLDYTARLHFTAGSADVRLDFTVENNHPVLVNPDDGQPTNAHDQGAPNSVYVGSLALRLRLAGEGRAGARTERDVAAEALGAPLRLHQDSSGLDTWNAYVGKVGWPDHAASAHPRLQSYCTQPGFTISGGPLAEPKAGRKGLGWMTVHRGAGPAVTAVVRDFWQNFPKAIQAAPDGTLAIDLFPNGKQFQHNLRVGEQKTHTVVLRFAAKAPPAEQAEAFAKAVQSPLRPAAPPAWYAASGALGPVPAADVKRWPLYERYVRVAFEPNPDFDPAKDDPNQGNRTLRQVIDHYNFYGWQDYGDVPLDYEAFGPHQAGQMNLKYWYLYGLCLQFCRSGDVRFLDLALPAARHLADIDILHIPDEGIQHWSHGAYFGHSAHDEPGNLNPNRNHNSPSVDLFYGVPGLLLAYDLTGERRFRDVALEGLAAMKNLSQFSNFKHPVFERERANLIFGYLEGYRHTGDKTWLTAARGVVGPTCDLASKPWLKDPAAYGRAHEEEFLRAFMYAQVGWTLGRYLDLCAEYGLKDDLGAAAALGAYADFLLERMMVPCGDGRATTLNQYRFERDTEGTYKEVNNWTLAMADMLAYTAKYTGKPKYLAAAAKFYRTGTTDMVWQDDPPVYIGSKDLVNSLNWGLVFMAAAKGP